MPVDTHTLIWLFPIAFMQLKESLLLKRLSYGLLVIAVCVGFFLGCKANSPPIGEDGQEEPERPTGTKIGQSFSDFATERWENEEAIMRGLLEDMGYEVLSQEASYDVNIQIDQIEDMVAQGVAALIVVAADSDAIVPTIDAAAEAGIYVIAYDNLIKTDSIAAHVSFNNVEVGRQQALGVMDALDIENWDVDANGPARIVKLGGSPTDNNAVLFRLGQDEILDPLEDAGMIEIVADEWVDNWDVKSRT
jgi:D-xylose transport system substrate-binding protein